MNVLLISQSFIPSVLLCGDAQLSKLEKDGKLKYRFVKTPKLKQSDMNWADILVFVRTYSDFELICMEKAKKAGKATVYVLDDNLPEIPETATTSKQYCPHNKQNILKMIRICSAFLSPSRNLISHYGTMTEKSYRIEEPALFSQEKIENDVVKIGFAGTTDRTGELDSILNDTIRNLVQKYGDRIKVEFFGAKPAVVEELGLTHIPYTRSYEEYQKKMAELNWDIGLAPVQETEFNKYKHYNKLIEYSSYGIAGVYTNCEPYSFAVVNGENGLLCDNRSGDWEKSLETLIENADLRRSISQKCLNDAGGKYSVKTCADGYFEILSSLNCQNGRKVESLGFERLKYLLNYSISVLQKYGIGIFKEVVLRRKY